MLGNTSKKGNNCDESLTVINGAKLESNWQKQDGAILDWVCKMLDIFSNCINTEQLFRGSIGSGHKFLLRDS